MGGTDPLLALGTLQVAKHNPRSRPFVFDFLSNAVQVEDMFASELDTRGFSQTLCVTNNAVIICSLSKGGLFAFLNAFLMKAREALEFSTESAANVATLVDFVAAFVHEVDTFWLPTDILEGWFKGRGSVVDCGEAEATLSCFFEFLELFASLAYMVGFRGALSAEVFVTLSASDTVLAHVEGRIS